MYQRALPKISAMDKNYRIDENCNGCGLCVKACQVENIVMENNKPVWQHHCEACYACLQWCPKESIQLGQKTVGRRRYHHPDIRLVEIVG
jgi:MinD superfamily P-loop ATPase